MPPKPPASAYPGHSLGRRVSNAGTLRCQTRQRCMRETLFQEDLAWEETADGLWSVYCDDVLLARFAARDFRLSTGTVSSMFPFDAVTEVPGCYT